VVRKPERA
jgi:hypothetical protein